MTLNTVTQIFRRGKTKKAFRASNSLRHAVRVLRDGHMAKKRRNRRYEREH